MQLYNMISLPFIFIKIVFYYIITNYLIEVEVSRSLKFKTKTKTWLVLVLVLVSVWNIETKHISQSHCWDQEIESISHSLKVETENKRASPKFETKTDKVPDSKQQAH